MPNFSKTSGLENLNLMMIQSPVLEEQNSGGFQVNGSPQPYFRKSVSCKESVLGSAQAPLEAGPIFRFGIPNWFTCISRFKTKQRLYSS